VTVIDASIVVDWVAPGASPTSAAMATLARLSTGGDDLTARRIAKDNTEFKPTFKFWFSSNFEPVVRSDDGAMRRRLRLIIFNAPRDPNIPDDTLLPEKLRKEYPGILRWAIDGCRAWQFGRNEYGSGLKEPQVVVDAVNELFGREDAFDEFLDECCQKDLTYQVETLQLWNAWKAYAEARGELKKYPSDTAMRNALTARGYQKSKAVSTRRSIFKGPRLK